MVYFVCLFGGFICLVVFVWGWVFLVGWLGFGVFFVSWFVVFFPDQSGVHYFRQHGIASGYSYRADFK